MSDLRDYCPSPVKMLENWLHLVVYERPILAGVLLVAAMFLFAALCGIFDRLVEP